MSKSTFPGFILSCICLLIIFQSCKDDRHLLIPPPVPDQSFNEGFDSISAAHARGWRFINRSVDIGRSDWINPDMNSGVPFLSYQGTGSGYIWADYLSTSSASGVISNWAVSPEIIMQNGDKIIFHTRTAIVTSGGLTRDFVNRLQVRINKTTSLNCGNGTTPGDFRDLLLDINPEYYEFVLQHFNDPNHAMHTEARQAFPHVWTRFEATVSGLKEPTKGRFAFRYFLEGAGSNGRGLGVGIDAVSYVSTK